MRRLLSLFAYAAVCSIAVAQEAPRLIVGITIDQLRTDFLESFVSLYGENGLKKLLNEGVIYKDVEYPFKNIDRASASASIVSGTTPYYHGITGVEWLNRKTLLTETCVDDKDAEGVNTNKGASARNLTVSTIGDELKLATEGKGLVYSIGTDKVMTVLSAGHAADWAMWIDGENGNWAGSRYYASSAPYWVSPLTYEENRLVEKPNKNARVTKAATYCLTSGVCGADHVTDFLALNYSLTETSGSSIDRIREAYVNLDMEIEKLLTAIDSSASLRNTLIYFTSTGYEDSPALSQVSSYKIPVQEVSMNRCTALLNMYLVALHGKGNYIEAYFGNNIYLDHKLLEQKKLKASDILTECENFLYQFEGIKEVYTSTRLLQGAWSPELNFVRNGFNTKHCGDIIVDVAPGCTLTDENKGKTTVSRAAWVDFPVILFGYGLEAKQVSTPITVEYIAPTVARYARIRAPNGSSRK